MAIGEGRHGFNSRAHIYVMYQTPAFLFYSIISTNPIVENMSQAKPRWAANPKLVQRSKPLRHRTDVAIMHKMAFINPRFVRKKQGCAGAGYIT